MTNGLLNHMKISLYDTLLSECSVGEGGRGGGGGGDCGGDGGGDWLQK